MIDKILCMMTGFLVLSCGWLHAAADSEAEDFRGNLMLQEQKSWQLSDEDAEQVGTVLEEVSLDKLVLYKGSDNLWRFGSIEAISRFGAIEVVSCVSDESFIVKPPYNPSRIKGLRNFFKLTCQPTCGSAEFARKMGAFFAQLKGDWLHAGPHTQGFIVPHGTRIFTFGDIHGDFSSLQRDLLRLYVEKVISADGKLAEGSLLVFTGDIADRGPYGVECWYAIAFLATLNPGQVIIVRGNHEYDAVARAYSFCRECIEKIGRDSWQTLILPVWDKLPHILFIGSERTDRVGYDFTMFCHGGFDDTWSAQPILDELIAHAGLIVNQQLLTPDIKQICCADFDPSLSSGSSIALGRGADVKSYSHAAAEQFMKAASKKDTYKLRAIIRGHQHMVGVGVSQLSASNATWVQLPAGCTCDLRKGRFIFTVISCPGIYGGLDSYAVCKIGDTGEWAIEAVVGHSGVQERH